METESSACYFHFFHSICFLIMTWRPQSIQNVTVCMGFPGGSVNKEPTCNAGDTGDVGSIPGRGRSPGGGHGNPPQYSGLENPMDRRARRVAKSWTRLKRLSIQARSLYKSESPSLLINTALNVILFTTELSQILRAFTEYDLNKTHFTRK